MTRRVLLVLLGLALLTGLLLSRRRPAETSPAPAALPDKTAAAPLGARQEPRPAEAASKPAVRAELAAEQPCAEAAAQNAASSSPLSSEDPICEPGQAGPSVPSAAFAR